MIPLIKTNYSFGKSILTLEKESVENGPDSVFQILKENDLSELWMVEDNMSSFLAAYDGCKSRKINLRYGVRVSCVSDLHSNAKDEPFHKVVLFARNSEGCHKLIKIYSEASTKFGKKYPTVDPAYLKSVWSDDLYLAIPYYDSYLFKNFLTNDTFTPEFSFTNPIYFKENNGLPFEFILDDALKSFETVTAKSIYYKNREDFEAWQTYKLICGRKAYGNPSLNKPNMEHCCSAEFCFESYLENK